MASRFAEGTRPLRGRWLDSGAMGSRDARPPAPAFQPVRSRRVAEDVIAQIVELIQNGDLVPGDRLPPERTIAAQTDVSRPTIRHALKVLAEAGVIEAASSPSKGTTVVSDVVPFDLIHDQVEPHLDELAGVLEVRRIFEPRVAQLAAHYMNQDDIDAMARAIDHQAARRDDRVRFNDADARFHFLMGRATHNPTVVAHMRLLQKDLRLLRDMSMTEAFDPDHSLDMHRRTLDAIVSGDEQGIDVVMDEHLCILENLFVTAGGRLRARRPPSFLGGQLSIR